MRPTVFCRSEPCSRLRWYQGSGSGTCFQDTLKTSLCFNPHIASVSRPWLVQARQDLSFPQPIAIGYGSQSSPASSRTWPSPSSGRLVQYVG
jgi:hypothetical protein